MSLIPKQTLQAFHHQKGSNDDGFITDGVDEPFTIKTSVQPLTANDIQTLPEGRYESGGFKLFPRKYTEVDRNTYEADTVIIYDEEYELLTVNPWQNKIRQHHELWAVKVVKDA